MKMNESKARSKCQNGRIYVNFFFRAVRANRSRRNKKKKKSEDEYETHETY